MDERYNFYKDQYFFELERKQNLSANLSIPIGFLTVIFSSYAYFGLNAHTLVVNWTLLPLSVLLALSIYFSAKASYLLYKNFRGLKYGYIPNIKKIRDYEIQLSKHISDKGNNKEAELNQKFFNNIKNSLVNTTSVNRKNNNSRSNYLYKINIFTFYSILFIILSSVPFFVNKFQGEQIKNETNIVIDLKDLKK